MKAAWHARPFSYQGRCYQFEDAIVTPPPLQHPHPPILVGGSSPAAAKRAGRHGCHFLPDADAPAELCQLYRTELQAAGHDPARFSVTIPQAIYVCDDPERGWQEVKDHYHYAASRYRQWNAAADARAAPDPPEQLGELPREDYLVGTPEMVAAGIGRLREALPFDRLIFWARPPGLSIERSSRSLELFAQQVLPHFAG